MEDNFVAWSTALVKSGKSFSNEDRPMTIPVAESFLICPKLRKCMAYLIEHVKPLEDRQKILLNIKHARAIKRTQLAESEPQDNLTLKLNEAFKQNQKACIELQNTSLHRNELLHKEKQLSLQRSFLMSVVLTQQAELDMLRRCSTRLSSSGKSVESAKNSDDQQDDVDEALGSILHELVIAKVIQLKEYQESDKAVDYEYPSSVWDSLDELMKNYSMKNIVNGISKLAETNAEEIGKVTQDIDLLRDAQNLSASYENDHGSVKSVQKLLVAMCGRHVENKVKCSNMKSRDKPLLGALLEFQSHAKEAIKESTKDVHLEELLWTYCLQVVRESSHHAQLKELQSIIQEFHQRTKEEKQRTEELMLYHKTIHERDRQLETLKSQMKALVVGSTHRMSQIGISREDQEDTIIKGLSSVSPDADTPAVSQELSICLETPVAVLQKICQQPESHDIGLLSRAINPEIQTMTSHLSHVIRSLPSSNSLLVKRRGEVEIIENCNDQQKKDLTEMKTRVKKSKIISSEYAKTTHAKTKDFDQKLEEKVTPLVDSYEKTLHKMETKLETVKTAINTWWTQPVKNIALPADN